MASRPEADPPLIVIVGPTASGKTSLAIQLAEKFHGEIICADSRTIYRDASVGTAKPTLQEQAAVPHWGIDLVEPGGRFTVADFKEYAKHKINEIRERGHTPFLVGGTGLYVDAILFDYQFEIDMDSRKRAALETMTLEELHNYCYRHNVKMPENKGNKRYVIRAIERSGHAPKRRESPIANTIVVGISTEKEQLRQRIVIRTEQMFANNVVEEATLLGKKYGWNSEAMTGNIYPLIHRYIQGELTLGEVKERFTLADWHLAKRQLTWLRRNPFIHWLTIIEANHYLTSILASE